MTENVSARAHRKLALDRFNIKGLGGFQNFKKSIFFCLFNNTICLEYSPTILKRSLLYGAGIDNSI